MKFILALVSLCIFNIAFNDYNQNFKILNEYDSGLVEAETEGKPIFLLFTGHSCKNNKEIEKLISEDIEINNLLTNNFINVFLYVDDNTKLPKVEIIERDGTRISLKTKGNKWANLELTKFKRNIQPLLVVIDSKENILMEPKEFFEIQGSLKDYLEEAHAIYKN